MIRIAAIAIALLMSLPVAAQAQTAEQRAEVRATIESQLSAFQRDDWTGAFTYASPGIREMFGTPERFGRMVRDGYPMVWRPSSVTFGDIETTARGLRQTVIFVDGAGATHVADYYMRLVDGEWRIAGVTLRPAASAGA